MLFHLIFAVRRSNSSFISATTFGWVSRSTVVAARYLAAISVVTWPGLEAAVAVWCHEWFFVPPGWCAVPIWIVGTCQLMSATSVEPPPMYTDAGGVRSLILSENPVSAVPLDRCSALPNPWSAAENFGAPICVMLACISSAPRLLPSWFHTPAIRRFSMRVPVAIAAASAHLMILSIRILARAGLPSRAKYQMLDSVGKTFGA